MRFLLIIALLLPVNCIKNQNYSNDNIVLKKEYQFVLMAKHNFSEQEAKFRMESLAKSLEKNGLIWEWEENDIKFRVTKGPISGVNGRLYYYSDKIILKIKGVPDYLLIIQEIIEHKIKERLDKSFKPANFAGL